ncbi:unnamed protein product [Linum trigynum]|uniref:S-protein homolog n=1 Tax=Linum trigynum TaxID=586398 RepID=A0AAV2D3N4_9ROSI
MGTQQLFLAALTMIIILQARLATSSRRMVDVKNELSQKILIAHCGSKDDDLEAHVVLVGSSLRWRFGSVRDTLYWCNMAVEDRRLSFTAYDGNDVHISRHDVSWAVRDDGAHLLNRDGSEEQSYRREWSRNNG